MKMNSDNTKPATTKPATTKPATTKPATTYIPPNKRHQIKNVTAYSSTEKKEPRKEHQLVTPEAYPTLSETMKKSASDATRNMVSFSSAAAKKIEAPAEPPKSNLKPGWVYIRRHKDGIQYKYGPAVPIPDYSEEEDKFISNMLYKFRLERQQYERDRDVERLGDMSEYYGEQTLDEIMEEYERQDALDEEERQYLNSDESDTDF